MMQLSLLDISPEEMKTCVHEKAWHMSAHTALLVMGNTWRQASCPSARQWTRIWHVSTQKSTQQYRHNLRSLAIWANLRRITLNDRGQVKKAQGSAPFL